MPHSLVDRIAGGGTRFCVNKEAIHFSYFKMNNNDMSSSNSDLQKQLADAEANVKKARDRLEALEYRQQSDRIQKQRQAETTRRAQIVSITRGELEDLRSERERLYNACRLRNLPETQTFSELFRDDRD